MKKSLGLRDWIFGKKLFFNYTDPSGRVTRIEVTEKWMEREMVRKRLRTTTKHSAVLFLIGANGEQTLTLTIGEDIEQSVVDEFLDPETGGIYGCSVFDDGMEHFTPRRRHQYEEMKTILAETQSAIDADFERRGL